MTEMQGFTDISDNHENPPDTLLKFEDFNEPPQKQCSINPLVTSID